MLAASDGVRDAEPLEFEMAVAPVLALRPAVVLMILDATDFDGTCFADALRRVLQPDTEVILALSKADLLPRLDEDELAFVRRRVSERGIEVAAAHAVSAVTGRGMHELAETVVGAAERRDVAKYGTGVKRNVVVCGAASVGKSTLINRLARDVLRLSHATLPAHARGPAEHVALKALATARLTESQLPGTTLSAVAVKCFASAHHSLYDTPGVLLPHAVAYGLFPSHVMAPLVPTTPLATRPPLRLRPGETLLLEAAWMDADGVEAAAKGEAESEAEEGVERQRTVEATGAEEAVAGSEAAAAAAGSMVLARVDVDGAAGTQVEAFVMCPPSVRARVVAATGAPAHATVPQAYLATVVAGLEAQGNARDAAALRVACVHRPLSRGKAEAGVEGKRGGDGGGALCEEVGPAYHSAATGHLAIDVAFASLGWVSFAGRQSYRLRARPVEGAAAYTRTPLYEFDEVGRVV